jgi:hypothetical protein
MLHDILSPNDPADAARPLYTLMSNTAPGHPKANNTQEA